jgi:PAS domain S-box-containing protein
VALAAQGVELHTELGRSKAYIDNIVESMGAGLVTLGTDERIAVCNPHAAEILGVARQEVEGADLRALPSPLGDMLYAGLKEPGGQPVSEEVTIRGGQKTLRVSTSSVRGEQGETLGSVLMLDDITAERELARERSRRERLDVLTKIVGRIAHEVKNPLTAVKTYAELMSGRRGDERLAKFWSETVLPEIDRLDEMLKNLLRMVEQPDPHVESARVEDLVEQALEVLPMAEEVKRQAFDLQFAEDLPSVLVDPSPTRDAIRYLLSYLAGSRPDPVQVQVEGRDEGDPGVAVKMTRRTRSNGGFDPDTIFDPLAAMQNPEIDLGPVISQKIITNQHGQVEAWRDEGRVTMRIVLPNCETPAPSGREVH